ncbi:hypothetical protein Hanom_Chr12g01103621 [Helianthus anomalus]
MVMMTNGGGGSSKWWLEKIGGRSGCGCGWSLRRWCFSMEGANGGGQIRCGGCCSNNILDPLILCCFVNSIQPL